jgi:inosine/xanthosine triphosphate pyrophosphatase family protein
VAVVFIDGNDLRAAEIRQILPAIDLRVEALQTGFATSAPEPEHKARDKVLAHSVTAACFAEAVDLTTMDGKSMRLELDSHNETRFCKYWRETPTQLQLRIAVRREGSTQIDVIAATCQGRIADKPVGPLILGWDRLFVPDDADDTLAALTAAGEVTAFRRDAYTQVARALGL